MKFIAYYNQHRIACAKRAIINPYNGRGFTYVGFHDAVEDAKTWADLEKALFAFGLGNFRFDRGDDGKRRYVRPDGMGNKDYAVFAK